MSNKYDTCYACCEPAPNHRDNCPIAVRDAEIDRLKGELRIKSAYVDRAPFCGDCRDKVAGLPCFRCENQRLKAELAEAINQRDEAQGRIFGAKELVSESLRALKHAEKAITREAWQSGPTIEEARKSLLDASKNIEDYGVDGYANALKTVRLLAAMKMKERDSANADADLLGREVAAWRKWKSEYHAAALTWTGTDLTKARADTDARPTAAARVKGGA